MMLPPLFPAFIHDFGLSYSELGLLVSTFFIVSGAGQALAGFVVDRTGARPVLFAAMLCFALASVAAGLAQGFAGLWVAALLAGVGNAPFHPADFTILNKRVSAPRLGHAFSVHGISGNIGWAVAPVLSIGLMNATGNCAPRTRAQRWWRSWCLGCCGWAARPLTTAKAVGAMPAGAGRQGGASARLPEAALGWLCFSFFWTTMALTAIQSFAAPALNQLYGLLPAQGAYVVTGYMLAGAAGMLVGGFVVGVAFRWSASLRRPWPLRP